MLRTLVERTFASTTARIGAFGLAYFGGAELGHVLAFRAADQAFAGFWPPAGLFLAALLLTGFRLWPAMLLAACAANLASDVLVHDRSVLVSLGFCAANCAEACIGAWLLRRFVGLPITLARMKDVLGFACFAALLSSMLGATIGAGIVTAAFGTASYGSAWRTWWIGDALGVLVVAPVVLTGSAGGAPFFNVVRPWRFAESVALFIGMMVVTEGVYGEWLPPPLTVPIFILPFLLWAALRFGPPGGSAAVLVVALIGLWHTSHGRGPYTVPTAEPSRQALKTQGPLSVVSLSVLLLAAAVAERKRAEQERTALIANLQLALAEIKTLRGMIPICAWCKKIRDDQDYWHTVEEYVSDHTEAQFSHGMCPDCLGKAMSELKKGEP
jgi:integral membrane sensor domain MASE1